MTNGKEKVNQIANMGGILCRYRAVDPVWRSAAEVRLDRLFLTLADGETTTESDDVGEFAFDDDSEPPRFAVGVPGSGKGRGWCLVETILWRDQKVTFDQGITCNSVGLERVIFISD